MTPKNVRSSFAGRRNNEAHLGGGWVLIFVLGLTMLGFYLWGKVEIDFVLRENDGLKDRKFALQRERDDLRLQVDGMRSYQRIVRLAKEQGMVVLSSNRMAELTVDLTGVDTYLSGEASGLKYAGIGLFGMHGGRSRAWTKNRGDDGKP